MFSDYLPTAGGLFNLALVIALCLAFQTVGAAIGGRDRTSAADMVVGWGVAAALFTLAGTVTGLPFHVLDIGFLLIVGFSVVWVRKRKIPAGMKETALALLLAAPFLLLVCSIWPSQWDELSHWLPNVRYMLANDHFPGIGLPTPTSAHPGYPYGMPMAIYAVGSLHHLFGMDNWPEGTPSLLNVLLSVVGARLIVVTALLARRDIHRASFGMLAGGLLAATALNPAFIYKLAFTAYPDLATAVVCLTVALIMLPSAATDTPASAGTAIQLAAATSLGVLFKQDNLVPIAAIVGAMSLWEWRRTGHPRVALLRNAVGLAPAAALFLLWHMYSARNIPGGEMAIRPTSQWMYATIPQMLSSMSQVFVSKIVYALPMVLLSLWGSWRWLRGPKADDVAGSLAFAAGATFWAYNLTLVILYLSSFAEDEARHAASLWRYNTHLGLLEVAAIVVLLVRTPLLCRPRLGALLRPIAVASALLFPILAAPALRFDLQPYIVRMHVVAEGVAHTLPQAAQLAVVDYERDGSDCGVVGFELKDPTRVIACAGSAATGSGPPKAALSAPYLLVNGAPATIAAGTRLSLDPDRAHLLAKDGPNWKEIAHWPFIPTK